MEHVHMLGCAGVVLLFGVFFSSRADQVYKNPAADALPGFGQVVTHLFSKKMKHMMPPDFL